MSQRTEDGNRPGGDYLWDGSGPVDPEIARLEERLRPFRLEEGAPPDLAAALERSGGRPAAPRRRRRLPLRLLAAGLAGISLWVAAFHAGAPRWTVKVVSGEASVGGRPVEREVPFRAGHRLVTAAGSKARLYLDPVGEVEIGPGSEVELLRAAKTEQRLALHRGRLHATIWAPPRLFQIDTPAGRAIDLGCAYSLEYDGAGRGELRVENGWVALEAEGEESFVPAGASASLKRGSAPGVPLWLDAPERLRRGVRAIEEGEAGGAADPLARLLAAARPRDGVTLWHLLPRVPTAERGRVYDALASTVPPPPGVTREAVVRGDREALDAWWNALGLGSTSWWRLWRAPMR